MQALLVGVGGFIGSVLRFSVSGWVHRAFPVAEFPYGTLAVNVIGCLMIGLVSGLADSRQALAPELRLFLMIGLFGGFTTYSTFAYEGVAMWRAAEFTKLVASVSIHVVVGFGAVAIGHSLTRLR